MSGRYGFFSFRTGQMLASEEGLCNGMVNKETGEITAAIHYGTNWYREEYQLNTSDPISAFPYTVEDRIILNARQLTNLQ